jgi:hypothetical protein
VIEAQFYKGNSMSWRESLAPIIAEVIEQNAGKSVKDKRKALRVRCAELGYDEYHPYKIWLDEVNIQLGLKPRAKARKPRREVPLKRGEKEVKFLDGQKELFQ